MFACDLSNYILVANVMLVKRNIRIQRLAVAPCKIIEHDDLLSLREQVIHRYTPDIPCARCYQNRHGNSFILFLCWQIAVSISDFSVGVETQEFF
jgi:hypothetical protein